MQRSTLLSTPVMRIHRRAGAGADSAPAGAGPACLAGARGTEKGFGVQRVRMEKKRGRKVPRGEAGEGGMGERDDQTQTAAAAAAGCGLRAAGSGRSGSGSGRSGSGQRQKRQRAAAEAAAGSGRGRRRGRVGALGGPGGAAAGGQLHPLDAPALIRVNQRVPQQCFRSLANYRSVVSGSQLPGETWT